MKTIVLLLLAATVLTLGGAGCANVKPWQRGKLADYTMRPDRDPLGDVVPSTSTSLAKPRLADAAWVAAVAAATDMPFPKVWKKSVQFPKPWNFHPPRVSDTATVHSTLVGVSAIWRQTFSGGSSQ